MINSISVSPDGSSIVSGSRDQTIRIWDCIDSKGVKSPQVFYLVNVQFYYE
jgi:WD40 repeat protein